MTNRERLEMLREAEIYARAILRWHSTIGLQMAPLRMISDGHPRTESQQEYKSAIARLTARDLSTIGAQAELARLQISGVFEWVL